MLTKYDVVVIGAGIFGITAAIEMNNRGYSVAVLDPGPLPNPLAASNDISKAIRLEHGADEAAMIMMERALAGWERWNSESAEKLYHQTGTLSLSREPMVPGSVVFESYQMLLRRDHQPIRLNSDDIARRFPAWKAGAFSDGYFYPVGGYVESGRALAWLVQMAEIEGVALYVGQTATSLAMANGRVTGIHTQEGQSFNADHVIIAAGAWTPLLVPELSPVMQAWGYPLFYLKTADTTLFTPPHFAIFAADINQNGWCGFPIHPREGLIKIAQHQLGQRLHPTHDSRAVNDVDIRNLHTFLDSALPGLKEATITYTRRCLACTTLDGQLWIGNHPTRPGLTVAAGGGNHSFQLAPILGEIIADTVECLPFARFKWRELVEETAV
jgi:glycine/D-amino acid oxidase-like deaminating enzyme